MLSTFENAERQHLRRLEREKHLNIMDTITNNDGTFQLPLDSDDRSPAVDALAGIPLARPPQEEKHFSERPQGRFRWLKNNKVTILAVTGVVVAILLGFSLGLDVGEEESQARDNDKNIVDNPPVRTEDLERYNKLFSQVLDWKITPRAVLEDVSSAPGRALHWLAYEDILTVNSHLAGMSIETIRSRYALATLYFSTQKASFLSDSIASSSWTEKSNWLSSFPVCQWYGVECLGDELGGNSLDLVSVLNLTSNGLEGELPGELSLLQLDIRKLDVSGNSIGGTIPETLQTLKNLNYLFLGPNNFTSTIPEAIFKLSHLTHLFIDNCRLSGQISSSIGNLQQLQRLGLHNNFLRGSVPESIRDMKELQVLYLDGNLLTSSIPSTIGELSGLNDLRLRHNQFNGTLPLDLDRLSILQTLYLDNNQLSGQLPASVFASNRFLRDLQMHDNQFSSSLPTEIGSLVFLSIFYADGNQITGHVPSSMGELGNLESLFLFGNQLQGFLPSEIAKMSSLKNLRLEFNQLSGPMPDLGGLYKLETLRLNNNTFGGGLAPEAFDSLTSIETVAIHGNRFTGTMPSTLCTLPGIIELTADCATSDPEVSCNCCTACYHD